MSTEEFTKSSSPMRSL